MAGATKTQLVLAGLVALSAVVGAAWKSPDSATTTEPRGSIAAVRDGGILRRYPDGHLEQLTSNGRAPAWSRNGRRIAFVRQTVGEPFICPLFVMNSDGTDLHRVGQVNTDCSGVSWGPGDRQIAFGGGVPGRTSTTLWIINVDGTHVRRLRLGRGATEGMHPAWSPDGRTIVFGWTGRSPHPWGRLAAVRPDGSGFRVLVRPRPGRHDDELTFPAWSRDGKRIAFVRIDHRPGRAGRMIEVVNARGAHRQVLIRLPYNPSSQGVPSWSPAGAQIAFWGVCGSAVCVSSVPSHGGRPRVLLQGYVEPAWGPAGT